LLEFFFADFTPGISLTGDIQCAVATVNFLTAGPPVRSEDCPEDQSDDQKKNKSHEYSSSPGCAAISDSIPHSSDLLYKVSLCSPVCAIILTNGCEDIVNLQPANADKPKPATIDAYISAFPAPVQPRLEEVRQVIHTAAPEALEAIAYGMPTFKLDGVNLIHFAAFTRHIGLYPTTSGVEQFTAELNRYKHAKGSVQFPLDEPLPLDLIKGITLFRVEELKRRKTKA
jgi:uncharacterized protein YdhG (YjbR/CyaY superfamily)